MAQGAHRVLPDPGGDTPSTDVEGRLPSGKRAREEDEGAGQEGGKRRRGEERGAGEAEKAPRLASPSPEPRRRTGTRSPRRRGSMRCRQCGGDPGRSRGGRRGTWRSWPAT